jgi:predicted amidohydrolase
MRKLARELEIVIIVPIFERQAAGVYRSSAAVIDADGALLGAYRKMHIPDDPLFNEKFYFTPGDSHTADDGDHKGASGFRVWKTRYADIGVLICWDQWYPEAARITSLLGAEILFYPTAIGWHPSEKANTAKRRWKRGAPRSAPTPSRTEFTSHRQIGLDTKTSPVPTASSSSGIRSSPIRLDGFWPKLERNRHYWSPSAIER